MVRILPNWFEPMQINEEYTSFSLEKIFRLHERERESLTSFKAKLENFLKEGIPKQQKKPATEYQMGLQEEQLRQDNILKIKLISKKKRSHAH